MPQMDNRLPCPGSFCLPAFEPDPRAEKAGSAMLLGKIEKGFGKVGIQDREDDYNAKSVASEETIAASTLHSLRQDIKEDMRCSVHWLHYSMLEMFGEHSRHHARSTEEILKRHADDIKATIGCIDGVRSNSVSSVLKEQSFDSPKMCTSSVEEEGEPGSPTIGRVGSGTSAEALAAPWERLQIDLHKTAPVEELVQALGWRRPDMSGDRKPSFARMSMTPFRRLAPYVRGNGFASCTMLLIISNAVLIGIQTDDYVKRAIARFEREMSDGDQVVEMPDWYRIADILFIIAFSMEVCIRILAEEIQFFIGPDWRWNIFDSIIVFVAILEEVFNNMGGSFFFMRLLRALRTFRAVRVVRMVRFFRELRVMLISVLSMIGSMILALVFVVSMMFLFSVIFLQGVANYVEDLKPGEIDFAHSDGADISFLRLKRFYGSLDTAVFALFAAISGGLDWWEMIQPLKEISYLYGIIFLCYIAFMVIGVLNVIVGLFVDGAAKSSRVERDLAAQTQLQEAGSLIGGIKEMLQQCDLDNDGAISLEEFSNHVKSPEVRSGFTKAKVDLSEAMGLFKLLCVDEQSLVGIDEFVVGLMQLKGEDSKSVITMWYENKQLVNKITAFMRFASQHFCMVERLVLRQEDILKRSSSFPKKERRKSYPGLGEMHTSSLVANDSNPTVVAFSKELRNI